MQHSHERDLKKTATELCDESRASQIQMDRPPLDAFNKETLAPLVESRLVAATWTLRRMPDRERGFLRMRGSLWPDTQAEPGTYAEPDIGYLASRKRARLTPREIDQMQPALDLLTLLPDLFDRQILFWTAWHQDGEKQARIPWAKVRRSLNSSASRWTLKRRYEAGILWLAALVALQR